MKRIIIILNVIAILAIAVPTMAVDITVGSSTWYSYWEMDSKSEYGKFNYTPAFLYGPVIAVKFDDNFSLNSIFLYGEFKGTFDRELIPGLNVSIPSKTKRIDSDTSISYRINSFLKIFGGLKYTSYKYKGDEYYITALNQIYPSITATNSEYGPAAGLSCIFPVIDNLFVLANGSVMYLWGEQTSTGFDNSKGNTSGYNTTASIAYYIPAASVTLSLGGRYQYFEWNTSGNGVDSNHTFYGITAAATYTFSI